MLEEITSLDRCEAFINEVCSDTNYVDPHYCMIVTICMVHLRKKTNMYMQIFIMVILMEYLYY